MNIPISTPSTVMIFSQQPTITQLNMKLWYLIINYLGVEELVIHSLRV